MLKLAPLHCKLGKKMYSLFMTFYLLVLRFACLALAHFSICDTEPKNIKVESQGRLLKLYLKNEVVVFLSNVC